MAAEPEGADLLKQVVASYSHLTAIHLVATRHSEVVSRGLGGTADSDFEFASKAPGRFRAWMRQGQVEALAVSDGATTWKALPKMKQWTRIQTAALDDDDDEPSSAPAQQPQDLRATIGRDLVSRYVALARFAEDPLYIKDETINAGGSKTPCYVVHAALHRQKYEIWIDKGRLLIVKDVQTGPQTSPAGPVMARVETKFKRLETNGDVPDSLFDFQPDPKWAEVEMLVLPFEQRTSLAGRNAADFMLKSLDGEVRRLSDYRGKVLVVDFWATWCSPCRRELPVIDKLRSEFADQVAFVGVDDEDAHKIRSFLQSNHYGLEVLVDSKREVERRYGVRAIPTLLVIDAQGVIRQHFVGGRSEGELRKAIAAAKESPAR